jgi:hypothetical protein
MINGTKLLNVVGRDWRILSCLRTGGTSREATSRAGRTRKSNDPVFMLAAHVEAWVILEVFTLLSATTRPINKPSYSSGLDFYTIHILPHIPK